MKPGHIVILGGTGFVGRHLVPRLHRDGHRITVLSRNRDTHRELSVLPGVRVVNANVHDPVALRSRLDGADAAINLVGILNERGSDGSGFRKAHVELTRSLVESCIATGVPRLLQMSALRAGEGASHYLRTRGEADRIVQGSPLAWTIFRPSVIFGPGDGLFFRFASLLRIAPVLPLARAGAMFQPVYVGDVAEAFARALVHPRTAGQVFELGGPRSIALGELVRWTARMTHRRRWIIALPDPLGALQARVGEWLPGKPISRDNFRSLGTDSIARSDGLGALGIVATPMEVVVPRLLADEG
ncbi:MAG: complex I NDUFA9 subunit family protein [Lysobacteraceae bacterium]|nr:MAG: complex I NDUFA9 subunit family protein [Xanthomonadaceae bacterium]